MNLPYKVNFDICTFCNHKCTFCSNEDKRTLKDKVSNKQFSTVMDNVTRYLQIKELLFLSINHHSLQPIAQARSSFQQFLLEVLQ